MALTPEAAWSDIPQWDDGTPLKGGGPEQPLNRQAMALGARDEWLKLELQDFEKKITQPSGGEPVGGFSSYDEFDDYKGQATRIFLIGSGIAGEWRKTGDDSKEPDGGTVRRVNGSIWERTDLSRVTVEMFGAMPATTLPLFDSGESLQKAFDFSKQSKIPVYVDGLFYTGRRLNMGGAIVRSTYGSPGNADFRLLQKRDGSYVFGAPDWTWYFNTGHTDYQWSQAILDVAYGPAICSDINDTFIWAENGDIFDVDGVAFFGDKNKPLQHGLGTDDPDVYRGTSQNIGRIRVKGCGGNGINLLRGFEVSKVNEWDCSDNNGHGLYVGRKAGVDSATEYLKFNGGAFSYNRLDGVFFEHVRKSVYFHWVNIGGNGQYDGPRGIDPILGYDRDIPSLRKDMIAGVRVNDCSLDLGVGTLFGFGMTKCFGEMLAVGLHLRSQKGSAVTRDVKLKDNQFLRVSNWPQSGVENGAAYHFNVKWAADWEFGGNYTGALDYYSFEMVPESQDGSIVFNDWLPESALDTPDGLFLLSRKSLVLRASSRMVNDGSVLGKSLGGVPVDGNVFIDVAAQIKDNIGNNESSYALCLSISSGFQSAAIDDNGAYLAVVVKLPSGRFAMTTFAGSSVVGFASTPTINADTGVITIPAKAFFRYTVQRIDMAPTMI